MSIENPLIQHGPVLGGRSVEKIEIGSKFKGSRTRELVMLARPVTSPRLVTPRGHTPYGEKCSSGLIPIKESRGLRSLHKGLRLAG